jgi:nitrogen regulatory protein P-II 1
MKKIEAIIRPEKLEEVREALDAKGFHGMTVSDVKGRGVQQGITLEWRVGEYKVEFLPKIKLEVVVNDKDSSDVANIIKNICGTGNIGDGKMFISTVDDVMRIRTGERGMTAV